jgi:hypothetical protein
LPPEVSDLEVIAYIQELAPETIFWRYDPHRIVKITEYTPECMSDSLEMGVECRPQPIEAGVVTIDSKQMLKIGDRVRVTNKNSIHFEREGIILSDCHGGWRVFFQQWVHDESDFSDWELERICDLKTYLLLSKN